ncbi:MAG: 3-hydroxyacyl-ACP dehydratase FabZ [Chitinispirillia bacterium]|jgi:3-hydroxyacyl-[acyl-carrier-protein] dehydratase
MFDIEEIMRNVPHRYPFLLIDRVLEYSKNESVTTLKNITINEAQFQGHFPKKPIFPGVYIIENMAQTSCFLLSKSGGGVDENKVYFLGKVNKMTFKTPVRPGDQLITTVNVEKLFGTSALISAISRVDNNMAARGEMMFGMG